jgi:hypothetical protein
MPLPMPGGGIEKSRCASNFLEYILLSLVMTAIGAGLGNDGGGWFITLEESVLTWDVDVPRVLICPEKELVLIILAVDMWPPGIMV